MRRKNIQRIEGPIFGKKRENYGIYELRQIARNFGFLLLEKGASLVNLKNFEYLLLIENSPFVLLKY